MTRESSLSASHGPLPRLQPRAPDSHKGDFGRVLLVGGSQGMAGSIALAGIAALRSGAGLVSIATPDVCQPTVASFEPSLMTIPLASEEAGRIAQGARDTLKQAAAAATAIACGPGLGRSNELVELVAWLYQETSVPLVVDADGLNALSARGVTPYKPGGPRILTPHPGEFARLIGRPGIHPSERESLAADYACRSGAIVVLKGHRTVITDGQQLAINTTGNPGMATGGSGDVLTGVIVALVAQGMTPFDAARLGTHVHGLAGDLAAAKLGQIALIASDLLTFLPQAWLATT